MIPGLVLFSWRHDVFSAPWWVVILVCVLFVAFLAALTVPPHD